MNEQSEKLNQAALLDEFSERTAAEHKALYMRDETLADSFDELDLQTRKVIFDVLLRFNSDVPRVPERPETERDELVTYFEKQNWLPKTRDEAALAIPASMVLSDVKPVPQSKSLASRAAAYAAAKTMFEDSQADERIFSRIGVQAERGKEHITARWVRNSREGQYLIADGFMAREYLNNGEWPDQNSLEYYRRQSYWRGFMLLAAEYASDEALNDTLKIFYTKSEERRKFASRQYAAASHRIGKSLIEGVSQPIVAEDEAPVNRKIEVPAHILETQRAKYAAKDARATTHAEQSNSAYAAGSKEVGGGEVIRDEEGNMIGFFPPDDQPSAEALVKHELARKERRRRRFSKRR